MLYSTFPVMVYLKDTDSRYVLMTFPIMFNSNLNISTLSLPKQQENYERTNINYGVITLQFKVNILQCLQYIDLEYTDLK